MTIVNSCTFLGRLGQDPELQYTPGGVALVKFGLAVNGREKQGDEWVDKTTWVNFTGFGRLAENISQYSNKGDQLLVNGEYQRRTYQTDEGETRTVHDFIVRDWQITSRVNREAAAETADVEEEEENPDDASLPF